MLPASIVSLALGLVLAAAYVLMLRFPLRARAALEAYPRSVLPAHVLTALCLVWFAYNLWQVDLGRFNTLKNLLYLAVPAGYFLITTHLSDLLAVRGLCCLGLLAGNPLLIATRWQGNPASIAIGVFVYLLLIKCMVLAVYPHLWKRGLNWLYADDRRRHLALYAGLCIAAALTACGALSMS